MASVRVLNVVGSMVFGGIETWLMHVLRRIDRNCFDFDFLVHAKQECPYDREIVSRGCKLLQCTGHPNPITFCKNLRNTLKQNPDYDVIHSHLGHYDGLVLKVAAAARVPVRIAHSHNDMRPIYRMESLAKRLYRKSMVRMIQANMTQGLACSTDAAKCLFGEVEDARVKILPYGVELGRFERPPRREEIRKKYGIPTDALVIGHIGRFVAQKNHQFLIEIAHEIIKTHPSTYVLLIGTGSAEAEIRSMVSRLGISRQVIFGGTTGDIPAVMQGAFDVFLFPSLHEGLPLVLIEAQAAGLPCVFSDTITNEIIVVPELMRAMPLRYPVSAWAEAVMDASPKGSTIVSSEAFSVLKTSSFNIDICVQDLSDCYRAVVGRSKSYSGRRQLQY